jgi:hypothetical protein
MTFTLGSTAGRAALLCGLSLAGSASFAQAPVYEPFTSRLPGSTRGLAMGGPYVAGRGSETIFYNPAQLSQQPGVALSLQRYESASTNFALSANNAVGPRFGYGAGVSYLTYATTPGFLPPPNCPACEQDLISGGTFPASSLTVMAGMAVRLFNIRWGVAARYIEEVQETSRDGGAAFDLGAAKQVGVGPLGSVTLGASVQNLGADFDLTPNGLTIPSARADVPRRYTLGAMTGGIPLGTWFDLSAQAAVSVLRHGFVSPAAGAELSYGPLDGWGIDLRAGVRRPPEGAGEKPLTLGAGVTLDRFSVDYAFESFGSAGQAHRFGIRVR